MAAVPAQKLVVITIDVDNGKVLDVEPRNGAVKSDASESEVEQMHRGPNGFRHIGHAHFSHSSPGCVYWWNGRWIKVC